MPLEPRRQAVPAESPEQEPGANGQPAGPPKRYYWYHKVGAVLAIVFCFELGVFFILFPWLPYWDSNYLGGFTEGWSRIWKDPYFRGAVSGLGLVNVYISLLEMVRLRRFSEPLD